MLLLDLYKETILAVTANKARSGLTVLGVVIGIASVIAMVSVGQGAQKSIEDKIQSIGSNLLQISPGIQRNSANKGVSSGRGSAQTLTYQDALDISEQISGIKAVSPELSSRYQVTAKGTNTNTQVSGVVPDYAVIKSIEMELGAFISAQDLNSSNRVAVLGSTVRDDLFGEEADAVGQKVRINNFDFRVIGVIEATEGGGVFGSQDSMIFIPITTAQNYLSNVSYVSNINVQVEKQDDLDSTKQEIINLLLLNHNISDSASADFTIVNQADIIEAASSTTETFTILLAAIAGISLLVGGIGIMNMMLTAVTERTREIGLRKSIGAKRAEINMQFLSESIVLTLVGGIIGIILGWLISFAISTFAGISTSVSWYSVLLAFGVSVFIGIIFGYYPAQRASKLNPIDALRYE